MDSCLLDASPENPNRSEAELTKPSGTLCLNHGSLQMNRGKMGLGTTKEHEEAQGHVHVPSSLNILDCTQHISTGLSQHNLGNSLGGSESQYLVIAIPLSSVLLIGYREVIER